MNPGDLRSKHEEENREGQSQDFLASFRIDVFLFFSTMDFHCQMKYLRYSFELPISTDFCKGVSYNLSIC